MSENIKIGQLAKKAGVTTRTVRYYEELGLIEPNEYSNGGIRLYSDVELKKLMLIGDLKELGYSLEKIKMVLGEKESKSSNTLKLVNNNIVNEYREANGNFLRYMEIHEQIECGNTVLEKCICCNKKPAFSNCSMCCQTLTNGEIPLILRAMF